jgi:uncharacterized protein (DUF885 family)
MNFHLRGTFLLTAAFLLDCRFICFSQVLAALDAEQEALKSGGTQAKESHAEEVLDLKDLRVPSSAMEGIIKRYTLDRDSLSHSFPVETSPIRQARLKHFTTEWLDTLQSLDFDTMNQDGKIEYLLFRNHLEHELRQMDIQAKAFAETTPLLPFAQTITALEDARRRMEAIDSPKVAGMLTDLNKQIETARKAVEEGLKADGKVESAPEGSNDREAKPIRVKKTVASRAALTLNSLCATLKNWFVFYNGYDPIFTWWVDGPYKTADKTLQDYVAFLREKVVGVNPNDEQAIIGDPIGREALMSELAYEMIPYTPEELMAIANKEFEWCEAEMKKASRELGYGDDWRRALEYVKMQYVEPGKQPQLIRDLALEAIQFLDDHDLVTVPPLAREGWRMEMMSPERQLVNPFFLGGETISVSYPTNTMSHEQKLMSMRGNNIHFARATVFHEVIPGHHLQGFMTARYRPYRGLFRTPFWGEGWAVYWEMLLWDMNFPKTPENRIGMLFWRMHRCARIIFSLSFHLEKMTPQECIEFLVNRVGHELNNATAEVRRSFGSDYSPLYQAAYLLGGLQFRMLHRELVESGRMSNRSFHDAILKENRIPVEMVRAILTGQKVTRDFRSSWKFYID